MTVRTLSVRSLLREQTVSESFVYDDIPALYLTPNYEVRIVFDGAHKLDDYGVVNRETGVIENFTNNIGRAKWLADAATELAVNGYKDPVEGLLEKLQGAEFADSLPGDRKLS